MTQPTETLADLVRRYCDRDAIPAVVPRVSLAAAMAANADPEEEELHCFRVAEGVAVSVASQGEWLLFTP